MALGPDFAGDRVSHPPRLLKGVRHPVGLTQGALPDHPMIPLTSSELLVNGAGEPGFGTVLKEEIRCADEVDLICAFVGYTGFQPLKDEFRALIERGGRVRVITSTYLGSTSAKALDELVKLGADVRVNYQGQSTKLHAKAWLFRRPGELDTACVGSSNLSDAALYSGLEWNVRLAARTRRQSSVAFTRPSRATGTPRSTSPTRSPTGRGLTPPCSRPRATPIAPSAGRRSAPSTSSISSSSTRTPRSSWMPKPHQRLVLDTLKHRRESFDEHRHLVVAATGTGKTVIAALDYARLCVPGRAAATVALRRSPRADPQSGARHVSQGAEGPWVRRAAHWQRRATCSTTHHVFAMVQTLHRRLAAVPSDHYDVVYIDEAHHGSASSWREVIEHFNPREIVGLTATPERTDGVGIADLFGGEYTTELRLWEAVDDQLLAPFEYVGVDDGTDLRQLAWHQGDYAVGELAELYTGDHERVRLIVQAIERWVDVPASMRALGFCVTLAHAQVHGDRVHPLGLQRRLPRG